MFNGTAMHVLWVSQPARQFAQQLSAGAAADAHWLVTVACKCVSGLQVPEKQLARRQHAVAAHERAASHVLECLALCASVVIFSRSLKVVWEWLPSWVFCFLEGQY
jgi:hypothetical protein